jgi:hypothetical protein
LYLVVVVSSTVVRSAPCTLYSCTLVLVLLYLYVRTVYVYMYCLCTSVSGEVGVEVLIFL